ncbi:ATP-binding cassette sub-family F member 3 [Trichonephila clavipes]|uniref:ATP-binding cassette sub-family F member 3 n=1 Tax=Trichonephila clavipes TaxID=2585209 RepID=A0A8X6SRM0_TRICX|nr:ATP-binding cassette sub-family F member 3 [Trichonephila clavipes]
MAVTATNSILVSAFPSIDIELFNYIGGILDDNKSEFESSDHVYEAVGDMLHEVAGDSKDEKDIKELCSQLLKALKSDPEVKNKRKENKILSAPVCLGSLAENFENEAEEVSSIWLKQRETLSVSILKFYLLYPCIEVWSTIHIASPAKDIWVWRSSYIAPTMVVSSQMNSLAASVKLTYSASMVDD